MTVGIYYYIVVCRRCWLSGARRPQREERGGGILCRLSAQLVEYTFIVI